jgi:hypothetical protein
MFVVPRPGNCRTIVGPLASIHASASCEAVTPVSAASFWSAPINRELRSRFSPVKRGRRERKSVGDVS